MVLVADQEETREEHGGVAKRHGMVMPLLARCSREHAIVQEC